MAWQQLTVGKHYGGELVDVHVTDRLLEVWLGDELVKTLIRTSGGEIRKRRAEKTARTPVLRRQASPGSELVNRQLRLDSPTTSEYSGIESRTATDDFFLIERHPLIALPLNAQFVTDADTRNP